MHNLFNITPILLFYSNSIDVSQLLLYQTTILLRLHCKCQRFQNDDDESLTLKELDVTSCESFKDYILTKAIPI
jgi:hypothetical protein